MSEESDQRMIDKIKGLLAKANGTDNESEAAAFHEKAGALIAKHRIDESELEDQPDLETRVVMATELWGKRPYGMARVAMLGQIAETFGVFTYYRPVPRSRKPYSITMIGVTSSIDAVLASFALIQAQADRAALNSRPNGGYTGKQLRTYRQSVFIGFGDTVAERLRAGIADEEPSAGLILLSDFEKAKAEGPDRLTNKSVGTSSAGIAAGAQAGELADLGQTRVGGDARPSSSAPRELNA